ncbi:MAG: response regulator [Bryobacteraceae bacterium]|jgi:CheY-like chemotaxis protein|nr:response regulator [Bryobacteraceae bacterium]
MTTRVLLADDSPHAQRMGERILREEGYEVVTVTDGSAALASLDEIQPDLILVDVFLPVHSGYDICRLIRASEVHRHAGVILIAGLLEPVDEEEARRAGADSVLKKPFEASVVLETIRPLIDKSRFSRGLFADEPSVGETGPAQPVQTTGPIAPPQIDPDRVRAAVTVALDRSLPTLVQEITEKVLIALGH